MGASVPIAEAAAMACRRNAPVLCVDTCSLLDVVRAPIRSKGAQTIAAAEVLTQAQHAGTLTIIMAPTVPAELNRNYPGVRKQRDNHLADLDDALETIRECLKQCRCPMSITSSRLAESGLAHAIDKRFDALVKACEVLDEDLAAKSRAMDRAVYQRRPSKKGSALDANIIEHYFALGRELRILNFGNPFVFVSSNTVDYCEAGALHTDLSADFLAVSLEYTATLSWARNALGL